MSGDSVDAPVRRALDRLSGDRIVSRIWDKDPTVWRGAGEDQSEIVDRLGWLDAPSEMLDEADAVAAFADQVRDDGIRHVVVLGMGGSSLCPEVLRASFGSAPGFPELVVLDSTVPATVERVARAIDPARTLFIVSSKSGTTTEPLSFLHYFHEVVAGTVAADVGSSFAAITDPGTPLESLAGEMGFRDVFRAAPDVGGRYSALTHFGIVPAALIGLDIPKLLKRGESMAEECAPDMAIDDNPGALLGAVLGGWYGEGRDKLTFITSPTLERFGLWAEQLIAESTGKDGRGILPIAMEPMTGAESYGDDRLFAYLRLDGDDNGATDAHAANLEWAGHPVLRENLADLYDLGASFYRWEFATTVAGALLDIHPFNQPNVQGSKDSTVRLLSEYQSTGRFPNLKSDHTLGSLVDEANAGDYVAIMVYLDESPETDAAVAELRRALLQRHRLPSTLGYGPRFLHSTGQLHKGGKRNGLFLQIVGGDYESVPIPGESYGFDVLVAAQSAGDFQVLNQRGLPIARVELSGDYPARLLSLSEGI